MIGTDYRCLLYLNNVKNYDKIVLQEILKKGDLYEKSYE